MKQPTTTTAVNFDASGVYLLIARQYPRLDQSIAESVQNALDSNAKMVQIYVNEYRRIVTIWDDDDGASVAKFTQALSSVAKSIKPKGGDKFGQFGLGLLAPLDKCEKFTFTSCEKSEGIYRTWTFDNHNCLEKGEINIPYETRHDLRQQNGGSRAGAVCVWWRTEVTMTKVTRDRSLTRFTVNDFISDHLSRFHAKLSDKKITVTIKHVNQDGKTVFDGPIEIKPFSGEPLPVYKTDYLGVDASFELYLAGNTSSISRKGSIYFKVKGNPYRIPLKDAIALHGKESMEVALDSDVIAALTNGMLEGEITVGGVSLHPSRNGFHKSDAIVNLVVCLETWHMEIGKDLVEKAKDTHVDERRQLLGTRVMQAVAGLFEIPDMGDRLKGFTKGTIGFGHTELSQIGKTEESILSANRGGPGIERAKRSDEGKDRSEPQDEQKTHRPFMVAGPRGNKRKVVSSRSNAGVTLVYKQLGVSTISYEVQKTATGLELQINTRNPQFAKCEAREEDFMRYCMTILALALTEHIAGTNPLLRGFIKDFIKLQSFLITDGEKLAGMRQRRKDARAK